MLKRLMELTSTRGRAAVGREEATEVVLVGTEVGVEVRVTDVESGVDTVCVDEAAVKVVQT